jgi:hypothetical protein
MSLTFNSSDFFSERHIGSMVILAVSGTSLVAKQERHNFSEHSSVDLDPQNWYFSRVVWLLLWSYMIE